MKGVLGLAPVGHGIGQRPDDLVKLVHRPRPAVDDHERQRGLFLGPHVDEVDVQAVNGCRELVELVQLSLVGLPVVLLAPVGNEVFHILEIDPVSPTRAIDRVRKARAVQAFLQVL